VKYIHLHTSRTGVALGALLFVCIACGGGVVADPPPVPRAGLANTASLPPPATYTLDPPHTFVWFAAKHEVVGTVRGRFDKVTGVIVVSQDPSQCSVDVVIDSASLSTQNATRDEDLKSPAFFDTARFPTAEYHGHGVRRSTVAWTMDGTLTTRGITKAVPLEFTFRGTAPPSSGKPARVAFRARADLKRADFGMTRDLLEELGPNPTCSDVAIEIDTEALAK
jgi:polyisoprenoid-binding protein YceI